MTAGEDVAPFMTDLLSPKNPLVQQARLLARDRKVRDESGLAVLEGVRLAEEALRAGLALAYALYTPELAGRDRGAALIQGLRAAGVPLHAVSTETLDRAADTRTPQGILAVFRIPRRSQSEIGSGLVVLLDGVQDPGNVGTVIRTLEALGGAGVLVGGGADPYSPKVVRGAMGSLFRLPVVTGETEPLLRELKAGGRRVYVADAGGELRPWTADLAGDVAVVIGNEGAGPSSAARWLADGVISIPMPGDVESLNAGVAASLLIYEALRQKVGPPGGRLWKGMAP
ncbi:MAG TPA: RNA methyltransferase [Symbiobacteriaceae bacterium]|jgi:TrmH family RNA methyltransferase